MYKGDYKGDSSQSANRKMQGRGPKKKNENLKE